MGSLEQGYRAFTLLWPYMVNELVTEKAENFQNQNFKLINFTLTIVTEKK